MRRSGRPPARSSGAVRAASSRSRWRQRRSTPLPGPGDKPVLCLAHVTNQMAVSGGDFEKGEADGAYASMEVIAAVARAWRERRPAAIERRSARCCAIAIMAKAPRVGEAKTRLVPALSPEEAACAQRLLYS